MPAWDSSGTSNPRRVRMKLGKVLYSDLRTSIALETESEHEVKLLGVKTSECKAELHGNCPGAQNHGVFKMPDTRFNEVTRGLFGASLLHCLCNCHKKIDET
jgi:hypothetical protein